MMDCPRKFLIKSLINEPVPVMVWLQGTIEQTVMTDILIISDGSGRAKITKCDSADGIIDRNSLQKGSYCCVIGKCVNNKGLPEIQASKIIDLTSQTLLKEAWPIEVKNIDLYLQHKITPNLRL